MFSYDSHFTKLHHHNVSKSMKEAKSLTFLPPTQMFYILQHNFLKLMKEEKRPTFLPPTPPATPAPPFIVNSVRQVHISPKFSLQQMIFMGAGPTGLAPGLALVLLHVYFSFSSALYSNSSAFHSNSFSIRKNFFSSSFQWAMFEQYAKVFSKISHDFSTSGTLVNSS